MLFNIRISFSNYQIVQRSMTWVGFDNFVALFTERGDRMLLAIRNNFLYAMVTTPFIMLFRLIFAVMVNSLKRSQLLFRICFYLPVITSWVIVGNVFAYMFNAGGAGLINYLLKDIFHILPEYVSWLNRTWTANLVIWLLGIWKNIGWAMVIYLAGLQGISIDLYEASMLDGANRVQQFWRITVPLLKSTTFYVLVNMIIGSFGVLIQVMILTSGNPRGTTSVLQYLSKKNGGFHPLLTTKSSRNSVRGLLAIYSGMRITRNPMQRRANSNPFSHSVIGSTCETRALTSS